MMKIIEEAMNTDHWLNSSWQKRLPELLILFILGMIALSYKDRDSCAFYIPPLESVLGNTTTTIATFNPGFAYPIWLKGHQCTPSELSICISDISQQMMPCCEALGDVDAVPEETVPNQLKYAIIFGVTITVITLRIFFWRWVYTPSQVRSVGNLFWFLCWWDSALALLISCAYTGNATAILKYGIGYPRPNYYALMIFSSVHASDREGINETATLSTPSGHAAMSMCAFALVSALLISDAYYIRRTGIFAGQPYYKILGYFALGLMLIPLYIGVSRVFDYFHFNADVILGWMIGLFFSMFSFNFHCDFKNFFLAMQHNKKAVEEETTGGEQYMDDGTQELAPRVLSSELK